MLHTTRGIVLRTIKYGDTSLICHVFTELFGLQTYMVKGVRSSKKSSTKANLLYPASVLEMVVYYQPNKNFQLLKEFQQLSNTATYHEDVVRNCIALFAMEVLSQFITEHDVQPELFYWVTDFLQQLSVLPLSNINNLPLYFLIQVGRLSGYQLSGKYSDEYRYINLQEGIFCKNGSNVPPFIEGAEAAAMSTLNQCNSIAELLQLENLGPLRRNLLQHFLLFYKLHVPQFKDLRSLPVMTTILS
jgi:DNA repair protein RecO (recombination protein O)